MDRLYLFCYNRLFKITRRNKQGLSYNLEPNEIKNLTFLFDFKKIPYKTEAGEKNCVVDYPTGDNKEPANTKVVINVNDKLYNVANYNSFFIRYSTANLICKAFNNKGIKADCYIVNTGKSKHA